MYDFPRISVIRDGNVPRVDFPMHPWEGFDPSCLPDVHFGGPPPTNPDDIEGAFWPISPINGDATVHNLAACEAEFEKVEAVLATAVPPTGAWFFGRLNRVRLMSWVAQLRGDEGAIPPEAGPEYRQWINWLREHDPSQGNDPSYEITEEDRERTEQAIQRYAKRCAVWSRAEKERLEAAGIVKRYFPGKENDPKRLPR